LVLLGGCAWPVRLTTNQIVQDLADHPFDVAPESTKEAVKSSAEVRSSDGVSASSRSSPPTAPEAQPATDVRTTAWMEVPRDSAERDVPVIDEGVLKAAGMPSQPVPALPEGERPKLDLHIPPQIPGSEAPLLVLPKERAARDREILRVFPEPLPLPVEPKPQPGPDGRPYTLADFQRLAAANSPQLRQAVADLQAARGNLIQAMTYPNPTFAYLVDPTNNNATAGVQGGFIDQPIRTGGKQKLGVAAAQKDLENAQLAIKRARSDLSTAVRTTYFTLLVDVETLVVTRALARFSDDVYRLQVRLLTSMSVAPYEPASLRAQAYTTRLAYKQAIASYVYDWKILTATIGLHQLPLSEIAGQVDRMIPYYDYDEVLAYALRNHTDILSARNTLRKAQYNLKLAQVTPIVPDLDVQAHLERDFTLSPFGTYASLVVAAPIPVWDQNKGNIIAAQGALVRAGEESHRVEVALTTALGAAFTNYQNNLYAIEDYRRYILPDLIRYYRGVFDRRQIDPNAAFGDLVFAQQNLATNVTTYLGVLQSLWMAAVGVADFFQTDDLFQLAKPRSLPELPDFTQLSHWSCDHAAALPLCAIHGSESGPHAVASGAGIPLSPADGGVLVPAAGSGTDTAPIQAGDVAAPPPPPQATDTSAPQRPADRADRPPTPPGQPERHGTTRLNRGHIPEIGVATLIKSYFSWVKDRGSQVPYGPTSLTNSYFNKEDARGDHALDGPVALTKSYFGEEEDRRDPALPPQWRRFVRFDQ
jgi:cobalt-zinc-cadmium efflux system outer membrane protein